MASACAATLKPFPCCHIFAECRFSTFPGAGPTHATTRIENGRNALLTAFFLSPFTFGRVRFPAGRLFHSLGQAIDTGRQTVKIKTLVAACAVLAATLGAAVAPAEAQPMMMHHHHHMMMRHHMHPMMHHRMMHHMMMRHRMHRMMRHGM